MVTFVLDASAILRYLDGEAGGERVETILLAHAEGFGMVVVSAINWGEVAGILFKRHGLESANSVLRHLRALNFEIVPATAERSERASRIRIQRNLPYADAFCVELASDSTDHVLVTADFDMKPAENEVHIEFLPAKLPTRL